MSVTDPRSPLSMGTRTPDLRVSDLQRLLSSMQARLRLQAAASTISPRHDLPVRWERRRLLPVALALVAVLMAQFAPIPGFGLSEHDRIVQAQVNAERKEIEELKKAIQSQPALANDPARQA